MDPLEGGQARAVGLTATQSGLSGRGADRWSAFSNERPPHERIVLPSSPRSTRGHAYKTQGRLPGTDAPPFQIRHRREVEGHPTLRAWLVKETPTRCCGPGRWWVTICGILLALCSLRDGVQAEWYLGAYGGVTMPHATGFRQPSSSVHTDFASDLNFTHGPIAGLKLGNYVLSGGLFDDKWVGVEAEVLYAHPSFRPTMLTGVDTSTGSSTTAVIPPTSLCMLGGTLNVMFRYPGMHVLPYVGVGLGGVHFSSADTGLSTVNSNKLLLNLMAGMEVKLTERFGVLVEFKHLISNFEFQSGHNTSTFQTENIVGGLTWHF